jgi:predicted ester cyclase
MPPASPAAVHTRMVELVTAGRRTEALALVHPDVIDHRGGTSGDHVGFAAWKAKYDRLDTRVRDFSVALDQNVAAGDFSANRYTLRGTDIASGRSYEVTGLDMIRVRNGKLVEHWALLDSAAIQHQLSAPAEDDPRTP